MRAVLATPSWANQAAAAQWPGAQPMVRYGQMLIPGGLSGVLGFLGAPTPAIPDSVTTVDQAIADGYSQDQIVAKFGYNAYADATSASFSPSSPNVHAATTPTGTSVANVQTNTSYTGPVDTAGMTQGGVPGGAPVTLSTGTPLGTSSTSSGVVQGPSALIAAVQSARSVIPATTAGSPLNPISRTAGPAAINTARAPLLSPLAVQQTPLPATCPAGYEPDGQGNCVPISTSSGAATGVTDTGIPTWFWFALGGLVLVGGGAFFFTGRRKR